MVEEELPQQIYIILENSSETFYHVLFLEVYKSYKITPVGFNIKKTLCVGKLSKKFFLLQQNELAAPQFKLTELTIIEFVQKLLDLETKFISKFGLHTVQEDWLLKIRNHFQKYEKKLRLKKLKKIWKLASTNDLYLHAWNVQRFITIFFV